MLVGNSTIYEWTTRDYKYRLCRLSDESDTTMCYTSERENINNKYDFNETYLNAEDVIKQLCELLNNKLEE